MTDDRGRYCRLDRAAQPYGGTPVSLAGYTLTDDPDEPAKWALPVITLAPGDFLLVWASGADRMRAEGWHTNFRLSRGGEYVGLFGPDGQLVDGVTFRKQEVDVSLGRLGTLADRWVFFPIPTPGAANTTTPRAPPGAPAVVIITPGSGRFADPVMVAVAGTRCRESTVYYTLDGADPTVGWTGIHGARDARADDSAAGRGAARRRAGECRDYSDVPGGRRRPACQWYRW